MEKEIVEYYNKAFSISEKVIDYARTLLVENSSAFEIAEKIEQRVLELGGKLAFPVNICVNEIAAHYSPPIGDTLVLKKNDLVKIDLGVHVEGYICDRAFTVCIGEKSHPLIEVAEDTLKKILEIIKPGKKVFEISEKIEELITSKGFNPVRNLSGHGLERFVLHAPPTIPNGKNTIQDEIKEGQVIAMEIFVTNGVGLVKESGTTLIYQYNQDKPVRYSEARKILSLAKEKFYTLPFAKRWVKEISQLKLDLAFRELVDIGALIEHPILKEVSGGLIAQAEETIVIK
jgi:methionyl aminopeptidase